MAAKEPVTVRLKALKNSISRRGSSLNAGADAREVRIHLDESFEQDNGFSYDYVMVFKVHDENTELSQLQKEFSMRTILQRLAKGGVETKMFYSVDREHVFCKLRASLERIGKEADRIDYKVEFDPYEIRQIAEKGYPEQNVAPIFIEDTKKISKRDPYQNIFAKYDVEPRLQSAYKKYGRKKIPFRGVDRIKLMLNIIKAHVAEGGCALNLNTLIKEQCIVAAYPLHNYEELASLRSKWMRWRFAPWGQPLDDIKNYFGEKVGLYFAWLGHYTTWLIFPSIVGVLLFINVAYQKTADADLVPYYGLFMALWSTFYYEYWKRYNSCIALEWGMSTFEDEEVERPEYKGEEIMSPIDGSKIRYFSPNHRFKRIVASLVFVFMLIILVVGVIAGIFAFRYFASADRPLAQFFTYNEFNFSAQVASIINAILIMVLNNLYSGMAERLNNFENHRTDTEYEDHLIGKTFMFQFVNSYASLFYIAFIKNNIRGSSCDKGSCMGELAMALGFIFVIRLTTGNFFEVGLPWIQRKLSGISTPKSSDEKRNAMRCEPSAIELQMGLSIYDQRGTFDDYNEMIIQFGYVTLFVVAFPLAPVLALLNNYFEIRIDAHKLIRETRRPDPSGAQDIGTWGTIIEIMSSISVISNVALVCFTSVLTTKHLSAYDRVWLFTGVEHALILLKYFLQLIVDDEPQDVVLQKQRTEFIVDKIVNLIADEDDEALAKGNQVRVDLTVFDEDI